MFEILFLLGAVLLLGYIGYYIFQRTRVPEPVVLILFGFIFGEIGLFWLAPQGVDPILIKSLAPILGALAIVFFLFEAGFSLNLPLVLRQLSFSTAFSFSNIILSFTICWFVLQYVFMWSSGAALLAAAILAGPSALSVNAMLDLFPASGRVRSILHIEGILTTVIVPIISLSILYYLGIESSSEQLFKSVIYSFAFSLLLGVLVGLLWFNLLKNLKMKKFAYISTMALMLILFFIDFSLTNIGVVSITAAGMVMGNYGRIAENLKIKLNFDLGEEFAAPQREIMMLIKAFFFAYIGLTLSASKITYLAVLAAVAITICLLLVRFTTLYFKKFFPRASFHKEDVILAIVMPRGILNAALAVFVFLPNYTTPQGFDPTLIFIVILLSMVSTTAALNYYERKYRATLLFRKQIELKGGVKVTIRATTADDLQNLKRFINDLVAEGAMIAYDRRIRNENDMEVLHGDLEKANRGESIFWVAEINGRIVARAKAVRNSLRARNNVELSIYVAKEFRGIGLGRAMLSMIIIQAKEQFNPKNIFLSVFTKNRPAIKLYKSLGFKIVGKLPEWGQFGSEYLDEYYMVYSPNSV